MECVFTLTNDNADLLVEVPQPYPAAWFPEVDDDFDMPDGFDPAVMNQLSCDGQYVGMVAQNGVPFTHRYPDVIAPQTLGAESYYMNDREERPVTLVDSAGNEIKRPAGAIGYGHSDTDVETIEEIFAYHDRDMSEQWSGALMERALIRARMIEYSDDSGDYLLAVGGLVPGVTNREMAAIQNAESSLEFYMIRNAIGHLEMQVVSTALVIQGNTRTSKSTSEPLSRASRQAEIRFVKDTAMPGAGTVRRGGLWVPAEFKQQLDDNEQLRHAGGAQPKETAMADTETIDLAAVRGPLEALLAAIAPPELDAVSAEVAAVQEQLDIAAAQNQALQDALADSVDLDLSPLKVATISGYSEARQALSGAVSDAYETAQNYVWVEDFSVDLTKVRYAVDSYNAGLVYYEEAFTLDLATHVVTLAGSAIEVVRDIKWVPAADVGATASPAEDG